MWRKIINDQAYTPRVLCVRRTPCETQHDVIFSRPFDQGKITKKYKGNYVLSGFQPECVHHVCTQLLSYSKRICANCFCTCELRRSRAEWILLPCYSYLTNLGVRHSRRTPVGFETRNRLDNRAEPKRVSAVVSCALPGLIEFYSPVASVWQTKVCAIRGAYLLGSTARMQKNIRADCFCRCKLRCSRAECVLLLGFKRAVWYFCGYDCLVVALSVFCTCILSWSDDSSQYNDILSYTTMNKESACIMICIVSKNCAKTLDLKRESDVTVWRHKQRTPSNNDHHTPLLTMGEITNHCPDLMGIPLYCIWKSL